MKTRCQLRISRVPVRQLLDASVIARLTPQATERDKRAISGSPTRGRVRDERSALPPRPTRRAAVSGPG